MIFFLNHFFFLKSEAIGKIAYAIFKYKIVIPFILFSNSNEM